MITRIRRTYLTLSRHTAPILENTQDPNIAKDLRIAYALGEIGPSVMLGAATTFLGIMPLAFGSNAIFRVFFRMFLIIISFGVRAAR